MSEGFTVRGFLVAADDKTRNARLKFNEVDWVDFLDEQFPLGGEVYISAKNTAADLAAAEERGRREGRQDIFDLAQKLIAGGPFENSIPEGFFCSTLTRMVNGTTPIKPAGQTRPAFSPASRWGGRKLRRRRGSFGTT